MPSIFYKLKKLQIKQIQGSATLSFRKCKIEGETYTAGDLKSENYINKLINLDEAFRVLRNLRLIRNDSSLYEWRDPLQIINFPKKDDTDTNTHGIVLNNQDGQ